MISFFEVTIYEPLYNGFVFLIGVVPGFNFGIAVILITVLVRFILLPLSHKAIKSQNKLKEIQPEIEKIKDENKKNKQEQARKIIDLYRKHKVNPFLGCLPILIQIPIIISLFFVFTSDFSDGVNISILYSFVLAPEFINMNFLWIDLAARSVLIAFIAGITQYFQMKLSMPPVPKIDRSKKPSFKEELGRNMNIQMRYILPVIIFFVSLSFSGAVALYWAVSNIFSIIHEIIVKKNKIKTIKQV